jgi:SAM-dependent methyltransferase
MENINCNICGKNNSVFFRNIRCLSPKLGNFTLVRCLTCKLIYVNPRPDREELAGFYPFWPAQKIEKNYSQSPSIWKIQNRKFRLIKKYLVNPGRLLDVGTGSGEFLKLMRDKGWDVSGVEYAKATSAYAREISGLNVLTKDLLDTHFNSDYFDLITLWDSLEHLYLPKETLVEIYRILKPDGLLVIAIPNIDNLAANVFKNSWYTNVPRHLYQFSPRTIRVLLEQQNFKVTSIKYSAGYFEPVGFVVTFKIWLLGRISRFFPDKNSSDSKINNYRQNFSFFSLFKAGLRLLLECIFLPLSILSILLKKAPNMIVLAKKC